MILPILLIADVLVPWVFVPISVLLLAYVLFYMIRSFTAVETMPADKAAKVLFKANFEKRSRRSSPPLPTKLQGVFWMSSNAAPELLAVLEGSWFDPDRRLVKLDSGGAYNWSYSTGLTGWLYWFFLRISFIFCSELHIHFSDDGYNVARMPLYVCGCCPNSWKCDGVWMPMGMWWDLEQIDDNTWDRPIYLYCMPWRKWELGSYILRRVIDENGSETPAFNDMMRSLKSQEQPGEKVKGITKKPMMQIMNGSDCFGNVCFGSFGNPAGYDRL